MLSKEDVELLHRAYKNKDSFAESVQDKQCVDPLYQAIFSPLSNIMIYGQTNVEAQLILDRIKVAYFVLPSVFQGQAMANNRQLFQLANGSKFICGSTVCAARGLSLQLIVLSDNVSWQKRQDFLEAVLSTMHSTQGRLVRWKN